MGYVPRCVQNHIFIFTQGLHPEQAGNGLYKKKNVLPYSNPPNKQLVYALDIVCHSLVFFFRFVLIDRLPLCFAQWSGMGGSEVTMGAWIRGLFIVQWKSWWD